MTLQEVKDNYNTIIEEEKVALQALKKKIFTVGTIRLSLVFLSAAICYFMWGATAVICISILLVFIVFLVLMKYHNQLFEKRKYCELKITNAENELKSIDYDFSAFDGVAEKNDSAHSFTLDLDIFGKQSFFQSLNRTVTFYGKDYLAESIMKPLEDKVAIEKRQDAIKELSRNFELLSHFRITGQMSDTNTLDVQSFSEQFLNTKLVSNSVWRFMPYIAFLSLVITILLYTLGIIHVSILSGVFCLFFAIALIPQKMSLTRVGILDKRIDSLQMYSDLFQIIEKQNFKSGCLNAIQQDLFGEHTASQSIDDLRKYSNNLFQSFTIVGYFILNPFFMWHILFNLKIEKWIFANIHSIDKWFRAIAQFDSLVSSALYAYNHPNYIYPEVSDTYCLEAKSVGHPMIHRDVCVTNDIELHKQPFFLVVTGANMAGKSTYLRMVGLNLTLASIGMPVFASSFKFYPFRLITNLRTSDSLADNESYFFAELKRLKMIIDRLQVGEPLFIILDEILKGTNSEDKQKGSLALMKQLINLQAIGIIATHDLVLGNLEKDYPNEVKNYRFEADIKGEQLSFTYKIREGVAQNMNATFLMKKMGITGL